jgi:hypothetical protein
MSIRTVRLDKNTEKVLAVILQETDLSITGAVKQALVIFYEQLQEQPKKTAYEIYRELNIVGDDKIPPARNSRQEVLKILQRKHKK